MKIQKDKIKKILIIKPAAIGDVLFSTPVIENLRNNFPDASISFLTQKYCREVLTGNPYLDRVLTYDLETDSGYCIIKNIRKQKYDLIIDLFSNPRTALITFLSGAKYRTGYPFRFRSYAYNVKVKPRGGSVHNIEFNLDSLRALGLEVVTDKPLFIIDEFHERFADKFIKENDLSLRKIIGINPSGTWETKVWRKEYFAELIDLLFKDFNIMMFWGNENEKNLAENIISKTKANVIIIPQTSLKYMAALMKKCELLISNDTGPMHIASVLGVKVAAIFGPTNPALQGPIGDSIILKNDKITCLACNFTDLKDCKFEHACMSGLKPDYVHEQIMSFLVPAKIGTN